MQNNILNNKNKILSLFKYYEQILEQVDIEWELERVKKQIQNNIDKNIIIYELEKLQTFETVK